MANAPAGGEPAPAGPRIARRAADLFFRALEAALVVGLAVMVVLVFGNVVLRYAFNTGIASSEELSRLLFVWMVFLGAAVMLRERAHLGMDTLVRRLPRSGRLACFLTSGALSVYASVLLFEGTWKQAELNLSTTTPVLGVSQSLFYAPILIFAVLSGLVLAVAMLRALLGRVSDEELIGVRESEEDVEHILEEARDALGPDAGRKGARA